MEWRANPWVLNPLAIRGKMDSQQPSRQTGASLRVLLLALLLIPLNNYWIITLDTIRFTGWPTVFSLVFTTVFLFLGVVAVNSLIAIWSPKKALGRGELLCLYAMLATGAAIGGQDMIPTLICVMGRAFRFATPENGWANTILPLLPRWLTVSDPVALAHFYLGNSSLYRWENLRPWLLPLGAWLVFIALLFISFLCLDILIHRRWAKEERLTFPLITLPLAITAEGSENLFRQPLFWIGFLLAGTIDLINGLHTLMPWFPYIPTRHLFDLGTLAPSPPWRSIGWTPIALFPFVLGIGFLMPIDLSLSCVFFYWVWKIERVLRTAWGYDNPDPYSLQQSAGVWMGLLVVMLWTGRKTYLGVIKRALGLPGGAEDTEEPFPYSVALIGLLLTTAGMLFFLRAMGMSLLIGAVFILLYLGLSVFVSRLRAELGPPVHDLYGAGPDYIITSLAGTKNLGKSDLSAITLLYWINRESYRSHPMPPTLEGLQMAVMTRTESRKLLVALFLAGMVGAIAGMWVCLHSGYQVGVAAGFRGTPNWLFSDEVYRRLHYWLTNPEPPQAGPVAAIGIGFLLGVFGALARSHLLWFPLHISAYTITYWWTINHLWFGLLLAGIVKGLLFRYGGLKMYRRAVPLFLGIILGEFVVGGSWSLIGTLLNIPTYSFQQW